MNMRSTTLQEKSPAVTPDSPLGLDKIGDPGVEMRLTSGPADCRCTAVNCSLPRTFGSGEGELVKALDRCMSDAWLWPWQLGGRWRCAVGAHWTESETEGQLLEIYEELCAVVRWAVWDIGINTSHSVSKVGEMHQGSILSAFSQSINNHISLLCTLSSSAS